MVRSAVNLGDVRGQLTEAALRIYEAVGAGRWRPVVTLGILSERSIFTSRGEQAKERGADIPSLKGEFQFKGTRRTIPTLPFSWHQTRLNGSDICVFCTVGSILIRRIASKSRILTCLSRNLAVWSSKNRHDGVRNTSRYSPRYVDPMFDGQLNKQGQDISNGRESRGYPQCGTRYNATFRCSSACDFAFS